VKIHPSIEYKDITSVKCSLCPETQSKAHG